MTVKELIEEIKNNCNTPDDIIRLYNIAESMELNEEDLEIFSESCEISFLYHTYVDIMEQ